jgi:large subunit ribosomal protein L46
MNTWFVGNAPVGMHHRQLPRNNGTDAVPEVLGDKVFFMKARIAAGQADLVANKLGWQDFRWLAKSEIEGVVHPQYWKDIRRMLPRR